jgi:hypothetical protein
MLLDLDAVVEVLTIVVAMEVVVYLVVVREADPDIIV